MNWYEKLSEYFPIEEMKSKAHMEALLKERSDIYHKDEGKHHILMFAEFDSFIFVDYLYVSKDARGQGLGGKLIAKLKKKNKPILLEVEPVDEDDADTEKRLRFYQREHFKHAQSIGYGAGHWLRMKSTRWRFCTGHRKQNQKKKFLKP